MITVPGADGETVRPVRFFRSVHRVLPAHPAEVATLAGIYEHAWAACGGQIGPRLLLDLVPSQDEVEAWFAGGFEIYRTAQEDWVVGVMRLSFPGGTCYLDRLAVEPHLRRRGHGRALVEHALGRARRAGATRVWTQVSPKLPDSVEFFHSLGFRDQAGHTSTISGETVLLLERPI
jgi:GNAT superfamily N-acetyltransferase